MSEREGSPHLLSVLEMEVLALLKEGAGSGTIASALGGSRVGVVELIGGLLRNLGVPELIDHPHVNPLDDDQLLEHIRFKHPRDIPPHRSIESGELPRMHLLMHWASPPSTA